MFEVDLKSRTPVYQQIKEQIMLLIQLGIYKPNDKLPSIREMSKDISVNVNTVKRAISELEIEGIIFTVAGRGCFVSENAFANEKIKKNALIELEQCINSSIAKGVTKEEIIELINNTYGEA